MSLGYGGFCRMIIEDASSALYTYYCFNWNIDQFRNPDHVSDGYITIRKDCLVEPEIHEKIKRFPNGKKKKIVKRIVQDVDIRGRIKDGSIEIENSSFAWYLIGGYDRIALLLIDDIFTEYQKTGRLPEKTGYCV